MLLTSLKPRANCEFIIWWRHCNFQLGSVWYVLVWWWRYEYMRNFSTFLFFLILSPGKFHYRCLFLFFSCCNLQSHAPSVWIIEVWKLLQLRIRMHRAHDERVCLSRWYFLVAPFMLSCSLVVHLCCKQKIINENPFMFRMFFYCELCDENIILVTSRIICTNS